MDAPSKPTESEFQEALLTEFGIDPPAEDVTPPVPTTEVKPVEDKPNDTPPAAEVQVDKPKEEDKPAEGEPAKPQDNKEETVTEKALREAKEEYDRKVAEVEALKDKPEEKPVDDKSAVVAPPATKEDLKEAIRELNSETTGRVDRLNEAKKQVIDILHPEGIDRNIYDTNGALIKTAQDIVDRGINNERTGEPYTYEEAASFILDAQRQMNENIVELEKWAENVAEKNIDLLEGNQRVMSKWGDILKTLPEAQVKELADEYIATQLEFDKTQQYITRMGMTPEVYYNRALAPYRTLNTALAEKEAAEAKAAELVAEQKKQDDLAEQAERNGLPGQRGTGDAKANTGDPFLDAFVDELNK